MVQLVIMMTYRPLNHSMTELWFTGKPSRDVKREGIDGSHLAMGSFSNSLDSGDGHVRPARSGHKYEGNPEIPILEGSIGSLLVVLGSFWFFTILGFMVPLVALIPLVMVTIGGFFICAAINHRYKRPSSEAFDDRCHY